MIRSVYRSCTLLEELGGAGNRLSGNNQSCRNAVFLRAEPLEPLNRTDLQQVDPVIRPFIGQRRDCISY